MEEKFAGSIVLKAPAKINLGLDVLKKREDGYHEVRMVMQSIYLHDEVIIERTQQSGVSLKTDLAFLPVNEKNIAYRAAAMLLDEFKLKEGVHITLRKRIPVCSGMAGGSSDAAAVLCGMNRLFGLSLSARELARRGIKLGADVPFCIMRGTMLAEGIGEKLTRLPPMPVCGVLIAKPAVNVSTKHVYEAFDSTEPSVRPDIFALIKGLENRNLRAVAAAMGNVLESVTAREYPVIGRIKDIMKEEGAFGAMMSGSGPSVFGLFPDKKAAAAARGIIKSKTGVRQVYSTYICGAP